MKKYMGICVSRPQAPVLAPGPNLYLTDPAPICIYRPRPPIRIYWPSLITIGNNKRNEIEGTLSKKQINT